METGDADLKWVGITGFHILCFVKRWCAVLPWVAVRVTGQFFTGLPSAGFVWFWLFCYCMRAWVRLQDSSSNLIMRPWWTVRSMSAAAMFLSPSTRPHPLNSMFVV